MDIETSYQAAHKKKPFLRAIMNQKHNLNVKDKDFPFLDNLEREVSLLSKIFTESQMNT